ncbi:AMP-binding protein [Deinococcus hopiensis]|uniref:AMP-binding protein n=1 Tax=Deinococcus hopiensis TaxID=309885 RepID=UPI001BAFB7BC|nr:AMP-binding protein [Deinococcus hopiensis]
MIITGDALEQGQIAFQELLAADTGNEPEAEAVATGGNGPVVLPFTSGTTETPKGVPAPLRTPASFQAYLGFGLDVSSEDVFRNAADPGWAYGPYGAVLGPLAAGVPSLLLRAGFSPALTWQVMERFGVTHFAAAPTVYRAVWAEPTPLTAAIRLRRASSAVELPAPDVMAWAKRNPGVTVRDHDGQTAHGMVIVNGWADAGWESVQASWAGRCLAGLPPSWTRRGPLSFRQARSAGWPLKSWAVGCCGLPDTRGTR